MDKHILCHLGKKWQVIPDLFAGRSADTSGRRLDPGSKLLLHSKILRSD